MFVPPETTTTTLISTPTNPPSNGQDQHPQIRARGYLYNPLTPAWSPPASCAGNTPTILAGTCNLSNGCSASPPTAVPKALERGAQVNAPHFTTSKVMTSTECMPPGYQAIKSFYFTSADGCPSGFMTATKSVAATQVRVACCPTAYPSATWASGQGVFDCYDIKTVTPGQIFTLMAQGAITVSAAELNFWFSQSLIGTTAWPTATTAYVLHPAVNLMYATSTSSATSPGRDGIAEGAFSVARLGTVASIAVVFILGVVGLTFLACVGCCCWGLKNGKRQKGAPGPVPPG